ncbi:MAG TPA: glycosyltransferase [Steroidobacteraceae bacterium]|nr:glycosyltransferase [Steroidobacteraceae bacterium]
MRVLMISDVYFPRINGVSTSIQTFRRDLRELGVQTLLITPHYPQGDQPADASIRRVQSRGVPRDPEDRMMRRGAIRRLLPELAAQPWDLVHIQTPFVAHYAGLELARHLAVPAVESYHTYFEEYLHHYVPVMPRGLMRFVARHFTRSQAGSVDRLIAPSRAMREALAAYGVRTPIEIIPTGLEADRFEPGDGASFRARCGISPERPVLVHVGRIAHEKNIDFLLRMLVRVRAELPDIVLLIAGEGPALEHCRRLAIELGLAANVHFAGYLDRRRELLDCYRAGDLFVFASRTETQGLVLLEAMAQAVPVVSTAHMGTIDILGPGRGCVVVEEQEHKFAAQIVRLMGDTLLRKRLGRDAQGYAATWSAREQASRLLELYREIRGCSGATPMAKSEKSRIALSRPPK